MMKRKSLDWLLAILITVSACMAMTVYEATRRVESAKREAELAKQAYSFAGEPDPFVVVHAERKRIGCPDGRGYETVDGLLCWSDTKQVFILYQVREQ